MRDPYELMFKGLRKFPHRSGESGYCHKFIVIQKSNQYIPDCSS